MAKRTLPPDPDGINNDRAIWAGVAIRAFMEKTNVDRQDALCDLLADLMHWCDRQRRPRFDFDTQLERARRHYINETSEAETVNAAR